MPRRLEKAQDIFREALYHTSEMSAWIPKYIEVKFFDNKDVFIKHQIDRSTVPNGLFAHDIQFSSDELNPEKLWPSVIGRRFGTVITKKPLVVCEKGYTELQEKIFH